MTTEASASKPTMAVFSAGVVLTIMVVITRASNNSTLTMGFRVGCSVMNSTIGGLAF